MSTHTHANLDVSRQTYHEVRRLLMAASYQHVLGTDGLGGAEVMDMHGIALRIDPEAARVRPCTEDDECCRRRPLENVHRLKHGVCERCGWNGTESADKVCPTCSAPYEEGDQDEQSSPDPKAD